MKKSFLPILLLALALILSVAAAAADTVYLNDGGTGNGSTAEAPLGDLAAAVEAVKGGGTIVITDTYTMSETFVEPAHDGMITLTGGKFVLNNEKYSRYYMSGPVTFEKITFTLGAANTTKTGMILARFHEIVMGEGVTTAGKFLLIGGYQFGEPVLDPTEKVDSKLDSHITIKSGTYDTVAGFSRGSGTTTFRGTSYITVDGGTIKNLYGASVNGSYSGSTEITVNGGTITALCTGGDASRRLNGDAKITVNDGKVSSLTVNNVMGHTDVYYLGGKVESMAKSVHDNVVAKVTDGTANLIVRHGLRAADFIAAFDSATYEDGSKVSAAGDAEIAEYTTIDRVPEKSHANMIRVYVSALGNGDGTTPDSAISDLAAAYDLIGDMDGTIVIINDYEFEANFTEPEHTNKIVITSYDGEKYYNGSLDFGKSRRFYFSGDTTFENTRFKYESSLLFVGNYHNMTFGTGLETPVYGEGSIYVVGGHQLASNMKTAPEEAVAGTITVESGSYYCFIGYSRGSGVETTPKGTQTINFTGGDVQRVYGGPVQANTGDGIVLNISGGTVHDSIFVGADQFYYSNNAELNISGGEINRLCLQNVIGKTVLNWTGGKIGTMEKIYGVNGDGTIDVSKLAGDATYALTYAGVTPTAEMLALFDTVTESAGTSKFSPIRTYENQFADVASHWSLSFVKTAYEYGLANGTSKTAFSPEGKFTVAQALTAAANIHTAYTGKTVRAAAAGEAWYTPYVAYCIENGIIKDGQFTDYNKNITRGDMAIVFANILPESEYKAIREKTLGDMNDAMPSAAAVKKLANAGIVGGDDKGNYNPQNEIKRGEACVIFTRIAVASMRDAK